MHTKYIIVKIDFFSGGKNNINPIGIFSVNDILEIKKNLAWIEEEKDKIAKTKYKKYGEKKQRLEEFMNSYLGSLSSSTPNEYEETFKNCKIIPITGIEEF